MLLRKLSLLILMSMLCVLSCSQQTNEDKMRSIISGIKVLSDDNIINKNEPFRLSYGSWIDTPSIRYFIDYRKIVRNGVNVEYFDASDKKFIKDEIFRATQVWAEQIGKPVSEVSSPSKANMVIIWKFLENDGVGGSWALSEFPPTKGQTYKPYVIFDLADMWQVVKDRRKNQKSFPVVALHELGHTLAGLRHGDSQERSVMSSNYAYPKLQIEDVCGARINYKRYEDFNFETNTYTFIGAKSTAYKTDNFKVREFLTKCSYSFEGGHFLSLETINSLQYLRIYYNCPIKILSSFRNDACNRAAGGATFSQHIYRTALDFKFVGPKAAFTQDKYEADIISKRMPLPVLLHLGARGFGSYPYGYGTNHIDSRNGVAWNRFSNNIGYMVWGEFAKKGSWYNVNQEFRLND